MRQPIDREKLPHVRFLRRVWLGEIRDRAAGALAEDLAQRRDKIVLDQLTSRPAPFTRLEPPKAEGMAPNDGASWSAFLRAWRTVPEAIRVSVAPGGRLDRFLELLAAYDDAGPWGRVSDLTKFSWAYQTVVHDLDAQGLGRFATPGSAPPSPASAASTPEPVAAPRPGKDPS